MNKIYKLIWNKVKNCWVAVAEFAKSHGKDKKSVVVGGIKYTRVILSSFALCISLLNPFLAKPVMAATAVGSLPNAQAGYLIDNWSSSNFRLAETAILAAGYTLGHTETRSRNGITYTYNTYYLGSDTCGLSYNVATGELMHSFLFGGRT